ncbi:MAG: aminopeptidase N C-terminal domain-containing protein, partial [Fibrobacterota bacterium]
RSDPALLAEMLTLPTEHEIAGWFETVPVEEIHHALTATAESMAVNCAGVFFRRYSELEQDEYTLDSRVIAERALRNRLLSYLAQTDKGARMVTQHFKESHNMTDTMGALEAAVTAECEGTDALLDRFSSRWADTPLVMDKWFTLQASAPGADTLSRVKGLMAHPAFDRRNPNRIRSLIGAFAARNHLRFHEADGAGYRFLREQIEILNSENPQVASRLIDPLLQFSRYDDHRRRLMLGELQTLHARKDLSKDLYEKVEKAVQGSSDS